MPTAEGMMRASTARRPPVMRRRKARPAARWTTAAARSGVTTDMTVTATMP